MFVRKMLPTLLSPSSRQSSRRRKPTLRLEALEDRTVPSGFALDASGVLTITGDQNTSNPNDQITVSVTATSAIQATLNGVTKNYTAGSNAGQVTAIKVLGLNGNDTLTLGDISGLPLLSGHLTFDGGSGTNTLALQGTLAFTNETEAPTGPASGNISFDTNLLIIYSNVSTLDDTTSIGNRVTYKGTSNGETINVSDGGTVNGVKATRLDSVSATFATVYFANKPTVNINGIDGADTVTLNNPNPAAGLSALNVTTGSTAGAVLAIQAAASSVPINYTSNANATVNVGNNGSVAGILGAINLQNPLAYNKIVIDDSADTTPRNVTLDHTGSSPDWGTITGLAPAVISYEYLGTSALIINGGSGGNQFTVNSTMGQPRTTINGGTGSNTFTITASGLGASSVNNFNAQGSGNDVFNVIGAPAAGIGLNFTGSSGLCTLNAPNLIYYTFTAGSGSAVFNDWFAQNLSDPGVQALARTDADRDLQLNRSDMMYLFKEVENDGAVTSAELQSLQTLVANAGLLNMPDPVSNLANEVINGNAANSTYNYLDISGNVQSIPLGNLAVGSSSTQLGDLVNKWFSGIDYPLVPTTVPKRQDSNNPNLNASPLSDTVNYNVVYRPASGTLFASSGPSYTDVAQGVLADCGLLSALGESALRYQGVIQGMFTVNDDGTYTVRFYNNGVPTYVTVDNYLPVLSWPAGLSSPAGQYNNQFYAAGFDQSGSPTTYKNSGNVLWVALAEKAYAQLAEEGLGPWVATNSYASVELGQAILSAHVMEQVTGARSMSATVADIDNITETTVIDAWQQKDPITLATGDHTWMLTGYDSSNGGIFTFTNPYYAPGNARLQGPLTWAQLIAWLPSPNHGQFAILSQYRLTVDGTLQSLVQGDWTSTINQVGPSDQQKWQSFAVGGDGSLYALKVNGQLWRYQLGAWGQIDGPNLTGGAAVKSIAVGGDGSLYDLETNGQLWQYQLGAWGQIDGPNLTGGAAVKSIAVGGDGSLYDLETNGQLWQYQLGAWGQIDGPNLTGGAAVKSIAVGGDGSLYDLETNGQLWQLWQYQIEAWGLIDSGVQTIAVAGDGALYDLETNGQLWRYQTKSNTGQGFWTIIDGPNVTGGAAVISIAVGGDGALYDLETNGQLRRYLNGSSSTIDTGVQTIAVGGDGSLYDLETNGQLRQYQFGAWGQIDNGVQTIAVGGDGSFYKLMTTGDLWQYQFGAWGRIDTGVQTIAVGGDGSLYDLETNGQLWQYQLGARGSSPIDSNVKSIVVDYTGTLYDLETSGYLWSYQFGSRSNRPISTGVLGISVTPFGVLVES